MLRIFLVNLVNYIDLIDEMDEKDYNMTRKHIGSMLIRGEVETWSVILIQKVAAGRMSIT